MALGRERIYVMQTLCSSEQLCVSMTDNTLPANWRKTRQLCGSAHVFEMLFSLTCV